MKLGILITCGEENVDRVTIQLTLANAALDRGDTVSVIFMSEGVRLATPGYADDLDNGEPFKPVPDLLQAAQEKGCSLSVCMPCLINRSIREDEVAPGIRLIGGADVLSELEACDRTLQL